MQTWDANNRLIKLETTSGLDKQTITYTYDPLGRRIGKLYVANSRTKGSWEYIYDGDNVILEIYNGYDGSNQNTKTFYTHGPGADEHLALVRNGSSYYYHADGLNSTVAITDAGHNVVQTYEYDSFGMVKPSTSFRNSYTYTGREWDKETGMYYYRARYYDSMDGRFISKDPIGFDGGDVNLYAYVQNNSINYIDPKGESPLSLLFWGVTAISVSTVGHDNYLNSKNMKTLNDAHDITSKLRDEAWERGDIESFNKLDQRLKAIHEERANCGAKSAGDLVNLTIKFINKMLSIK